MPMGGGSGGGGGGGGHRHVDSKDFHHHHHPLHRATGPSGGSSGGLGPSSVALAWPSCWKHTRRPLLLAVGALGAIAVILRALGSEQEAGGGGKVSSLLSSSASSSAAGQRRPGVWGGGGSSSRSSRSSKGGVTDPTDPSFVPMEIAPFRGRPWRTAETLEVFPVVATAFGVCEIHTIKAEDGTAVDGWLWFDEKDQVNVLARLAPNASPHSQQQPAARGRGGQQQQQQQEKKGPFLLFEQRKYGFEGRSLAPIGGLVEPGEEPLAAARRELLEEAGLVSDRWTALGRYRVSSTRGGGFLNVFFADGCRQSPTRRASDDMEAQTRVYLSAPQLASAVLKGRFKEAKWTQTVAMALLHLLLREQEQGVVWTG